MTLRRDIKEFYSMHAYYIIVNANNIFFSKGFQFRTNKKEKMKHKKQINKQRN